MVKCKIDVTKINKDFIFVGQKGKYIDIILMDNRDGRDDYGNDGFCVQGVTKEARQNGVKGPIIGNWQEMKTKKPAPKPPRSARDQDIDEAGEDVPF